MRSLALIASAALVGVIPTVGPAADDQPSITRYGTWLLVSAPDDRSDPHIAARLAQKVTFDFADTGIDDVAAWLREASGLNVLVMPELSARAPTVTLKAKDMSLDNVLKWLTKVSGVAVSEFHGAIVLGEHPVEKAPSIRVYDIADLTMPIHDFPGPDLAYGQGQGKGGDLFNKPKDDSATAPSPDEIVELLKKYALKE